MRPNPQGFIISGTHSGVGKTTASFAVMAVLTDAGFSVQPFKIGPDFIDPGYHQLSTGRISINLDRWMMGLDGIRTSVARYAGTADVAVIEGMGALHDGENASGRGSAAYFARSLEMPVLLVVDIWGMTRSTAAVVQGFAALDPAVEIAGLLLNRAGSRAHFEMVRNALPGSWRRRVIGYLPADERITVPERHLGLVTVEENPEAARLREDVARLASQTLDIPSLIRIFGVRRRTGARARAAAATPRVRVGIARDRAFCFYYQENLRRLREAGAELVPFSPVGDDHLPRELHGLYIGGGYPESFAGALAANTRMLQEIRTFGETGGVIYAECGGLMYLARRLIDFEGTRHRLVGLIPLETAMDRAHLAIRYVSVTTTRASALGPSGTRARGQEFHQSRIVRMSANTRGYRVSDSTGKTFREGFWHKRVLASYIHVYFGSNPGIPRRFVDYCLRATKLRGQGRA